jgi:hydrogenase maturation protein HypF
MLEQGVNSPRTSSAGRLFDGVAALVGLRQRLGYEGQAAMELEFAATGSSCEESYPFYFNDTSPLVVDWSPTLRAMLDDLRRREVIGSIAAKFHNTLVAMMLAVAHQAGQPRVVLTGGCFQNHYLSERAIQRLSAEGFKPYWHQRIPPNDGGIALGQALAAARLMKE